VITYCKYALICTLFILVGCQVPKQQSGSLSQQVIAPSPTVAGKCTVSVLNLLQSGSKRLQDGESKWQNYNWQKIYQNCKTSPVAAYNAIISLARSGDIAGAGWVGSEAGKRFPDFQPLQAVVMRINDPLKLAREIAGEQYKNWLNSKSKYIFSQKPPQKESPSALPRLIKGEFEKRAAFEARVMAAKEVRRRELDGIESRYAFAVEQFNKEVEKYNQQVQREKKQRLAQRRTMHEMFLNAAVEQVLGDLKLSDLVYDAESEKFAGRLKATSAVFDERITIKVPLSGQKAKSFKQDIALLKPSLNYTLGKDGKVIQKPIVKHGPFTYQLVFSDELFTPVEVSAVADVQPAATQTIRSIEKVRDTIAIEDDYYREALIIQDDPALAKLRQQQAENESKLRLARAEQARERERKRIEQDILQQQQKLASLGGTIGQEYEGLEQKYSWNFKPAQTPARDMVAVIIGNRSYGRDIPKVYYAYNDAMAIKDFLETGLGVPPENIIFQKDATKGEMEGLFQRTLPNRVTRGKTEVLSYFSGHGMPKNGEALLLPSDTTPEFADITGYPRDKLLQELADLGAKDSTVILDACFSGTSKDSRPLVAGKPVFAEVVPVAMPQNTVFISATRAKEIARMDDEKGMSLMTFYLLQGLGGKADNNADRQISVEEIGTYLTSEVSRSARLNFDSEQTPEVLGPKGRILIQY